MTPIVHITTRAQWDEALRSGAYSGDTLATEGFIHFSDPGQVVATGDRYYRGRDGLVLLVVDPAQLRHEVKREAAPHGELFPHLYGALNIDAVTSVLAFEPRGDGMFELPRELA